MRTIGAELQAHFAEEATTLCHAWRVSRRDGMVLCWGNNDQGQSGVGTQRSDWCTSFYCVITPTRVATDINGAAFASTRVSAGQNHSCALDAAGAVFCWGYNFNGQTGVPSLGQVWQPTAAASGKRFTAISAGNRTTCAVEPGATWCWGLINDGGPGSFSLNGDQSTGVVRSSWAPLAIQPSSANYQAVSVGNMHACMQTNVWGFTEINCIGRNDFGAFKYQALTILSPSLAEEATHLLTAGVEQCFSPSSD